MFVGFLVFLFCVSAGQAACNCESALDTQRIAFCGTDGQSHMYDSQNEGCFFQCNVSMVYVGTACSYPNLCGAPFSRGYFSQGCACWRGWSGADCSQVTQGNTCRGHGVVRSFSDSSFGSFCACESSFVGALCNPSVALSSSPFGEWLPESASFCDNDPYCDQHPVFNLSSVATVSMIMSPANLITLLSPANVDGDYLGPINVSFVQGPYVSEIHGAEVKIGGAYSKRLAKKGFLIKTEKLGYFGPEDAKIDKIKTKIGVNDGSYINNLILNDVLRSLGAPFLRMSFLQVYVNQVYAGFARVQEEPKKPFLKARFGHDKGQLFKCDRGLIYQGGNQSDYEGKGYSLESGDADWSNLLALITAINQRDISTVESLVDVPLFLRSLAVEGFFADGDGFACSGKNFYLYWNKSKFAFFRHDMDDAFGMKHQHTPCATKAISYWAQIDLKQYGTSICPNPLATLVLAQPRYRQLYYSYLQLIVSKLGISNGVPSSSSLLWRRIEDYFRLISMYLEEDLAYAVDMFGCGGFDFFQSLLVSQFADYINERVATFQV